MPAVLLSIVVAQPLSAAVLDREVSVQFDGLSVREALGEVARESGVRIELEGELAAASGASRALSGRYDDAPLGLVLRQILSGESYVIAAPRGGQVDVKIRMAGGGPSSVIAGDPWLDALRAEVGQIDPEAADLLEDFLAWSELDERRDTLDYLRSVGDAAASQWIESARGVLRYEKAAARWQPTDDDGADRR